MPSYPYTYPTNIRLAPRSIQFTAKTQASLFTSPFTGKSQVHKYKGSWWELEITLPILRQEDAEEITAFLNGLYGTVGTFYFTLPTKFQHSGSVSLTVSANNTDFTGASVTPSVGKYGVDNNFRLVQFTTTSSLFPNLIAGSNTITGNKGALYRLASNETRYGVDVFMNTNVVIPIIETMGMTST